MHIDVALKGIFVSVVHGVRGTADLQLSGSMVLIDVHSRLTGARIDPFEGPPDWRGSQLAPFWDDVFTRWRNDELEQVGSKNQKLDQRLKISISFV